MDKSLLRQEERGDGEVRFTMLETVREFGRERLREAGEEEALQDAHLAYFSELVEAAEPELYSRERVKWWDRLEREHDNLRAALVWSLAGGDTQPCRREVRGEIGLRMAGALHPLWAFRGYLDEGKEWLERMLARTDATAQTAARARVLFGLGAIAHGQGDFPAMRARLEETVTIWRKLADERCLGRALGFLGLAHGCLREFPAARAAAEESVALLREAEDDAWDLPMAVHILGVIVGALGDHARARACHEESLALFRAHDDRWAAAWPLQGLGNLALAQGQYAAARTFLEESRVRHQEARVRYPADWTLNGLARIARAEGDYARAQELFEQSLERQRQLGNQWVVANELLFLGELAMDQQEYETAQSRFVEALLAARESSSHSQTVAALEGLGSVAVALGRATPAARLFGATVALDRSIGHWPLDGPRQADSVAAARRALGDGAFLAAWEEGQSLTWEQAVAEALQEATHRVGAAKQ